MRGAVAVLAVLTVPTVARARVCVQLRCVDTGKELGVEGPPLTTAVALDDVFLSQRQVLRHGGGGGGSGGGKQHHHHQQQRH